MNEYGTLREQLAGIGRNLYNIGSASLKLTAIYLSPFIIVAIGITPASITVYYADTSLTAIDSARKSEYLRRAFELADEDGNDNVSKEELESFLDR